MNCPHLFSLTFECCDFQRAEGECRETPPLPIPYHLCQAHQLHPEPLFPFYAPHLILLRNTLSPLAHLSSVHQRLLPWSSSQAMPGATVSAEAKGLLLSSLCKDLNIVAVRDRLCQPCFSQDALGAWEPGGREEAQLRSSGFNSMHH